MVNLLQLVFVGFLLVWPIKGAEEPLVLPVWPGAVPADYGTIGPERVRAPSEAPTKDAKWITNVRKPTLTLFRPARDKNAGAAIVICPGGGYWNLAWDLEGEEVAASLNAVGVTSLVLKYRVPRRAGQPERLPAPGPLLDAQRAISLVRSRAAEWGIDTHRIGILGFSAGGHLAVATATQFDQRAYEPLDQIDKISCRPDFAVAVYPGYLIEQQPAGVETNKSVLAPYMGIPAQTPPIFLVHASDDPVAGAENSVVMYLALQRANVPAELHLYAHGGHGFGVRKSGLPCSTWTDRLVAWLQNQGMLRTNDNLAAEQDPRMVPPPDSVRGKLPSIPPTPARDAAKTFRVLDGFRMDLLAAEPLVASPVAMTYDENGRAYVCEMRDYPYTDKAHHQRNQENPTDEAIGTVRLLEDTDGDGVFDKSTVFAEGLSWPTGVACWKGGVFVAATPDLWYLKDTDGDGKADIRRKVFTGFRKLNVQAVMNNLAWGLDNHIHGAGSSNGGQIRPGDKPDARPLAMSRNDFRFDPVSEQFELLSGGARFGGTFDDWGHRFLCDIRNPAQHIVLPQRYLARNPYLPARSALHDMAESGDQLPVYRISPPEPWRVLRAKRWAGERDIIMPRSELVGAGVVTSSSGVTCYRGAAYPEKYLGNVFVCECAGNLFYRLQLTPDGPTFKATRVDGQAEMVASTDNWFRPVNFVNAPDGTLHVVDMYRENIEHPWSIPDDIHAAVDLESGRERGRLWRLTPPNFKLPKPPRLGRATTAELVATLENPNSWWRETAQRLLFERQDRSAVPALRKMVNRGRTGQARLHALWTLQGLTSLNDQDVLAALKDHAAGVRENAVKLAELRLPSPPLPDALFQIISDPDACVRLQLAFTIGEITDPLAADALATIARRDAADPWIRTAVLSSVANTSDQLLTRLLADTKFAAGPAAADMFRQLAQIVGTRRKDDEILRTLEAARDADALLEVALGVGEGLKRTGRSLRQSAVPRMVDVLLDQARDTALAEAPLDTRLKAIQVLAYDDFERVKEALTDLLAPKQPQQIQRATVIALSSFSQPEVAKLLLSGWRTYTPAIRADVINALLDARSRISALLDAIEGGLVPANQVPFARRAALVRLADATTKQRLNQLFVGTVASRKDIVAKYQAALSMQGDAPHGKVVFEAVCATCHRAGDLGKDVGPNLATIRQWSADQILINIIDPNREVAPNFFGYTVETKDGRTLDGIIAEESAASLTLKRADGLTETVFRGDIAQLSGSGLSLMPEGLETAIPVEQMADLIAFLLAPP